MAIFTPTDTFDDVYELATTDAVKGGTVAGAVDAPTDGFANAQAKSLANRTYYNSLRAIPVGSVIPYVGETAPTGWVLCNGAALDRTAYANLFAVCSTNFGTTSGTNFHVPDMRGAFMRGWDSIGGVAAGVDPDAASRTASGNGGATGNNIGTEQADAFEAHTHDVPYSDGNVAVSTNVIAEQSNNTEPSLKTTSSAGGSTETRPINIAMNYIIKALV